MSNILSNGTGILLLGEYVMAGDDCCCEECCYELVVTEPLYEICPSEWNGGPNCPPDCSELVCFICHQAFEFNASTGNWCIRFQMCGFYTINNLSEFLCATILFFGCPGLGDVKITSSSPAGHSAGGGVFERWCLDPVILAPEQEVEFCGTFDLSTIEECNCSIRWEVHLSRDLAFPFEFFAGGVHTIVEPC